MAISHADHDHPNTPAARAACRKSMPKELRGQANILPVLGTTHETVENVVGDRKPAKVTVVPRKRGDGGVVKGLQATAPKVTDRRLKVSGTLIRSVADLADMPTVLAAAVRQAWDNKWIVQVGERFNESERRVVIAAPAGEIALVWTEDGRTGYFFRWADSSITYRQPSASKAFELGATV